VSGAEPVVIVGGGQAAAQLVGSLRSHGYVGGITLINAESRLPYHRPPLSKKYLLGEMPTDKLLIRKPEYYERMEVRPVLGTAVASIQRAERQVVLDDGQAIDYAHLVLATGGRALTLIGTAGRMAGVHHLRSIADADALRSAIFPGCRVVLVGGGYIGLEVAASLRKLGCEVTVLEMQNRVLARSVAEPIAEVLMDCHARNGGRIHCGRGVQSIHGDSSVSSVTTTDGDEIPADLLVVGVGMAPNSELAEAAGLECNNGIRVDANCRTSDPEIFAIGDVACRPTTLGCLRLESVDNAIQTANIAAAGIVGAADPEATAPWFWSDQYDSKLQMVGLAPPDARWHVRANGRADKLSCFYLEGGRVVAAQCLNAGGDFMVAKRLVAAGTAICPERLTDTGLALRDL